MKLSKSLINFDETPAVVKTEATNLDEVPKTTEVDEAAELEKAKAQKEAFDKHYEEVRKTGKSTGANGITGGYTDVGYELKNLPGKIIDQAKALGHSYVRDAKEAYHGWKGEVADKRDEKGDVVSWKPKEVTFFKTDEDKLKEQIARRNKERVPNNNAVTGTLGFRTAEVASPLLIGGAFLGYKLHQKKKRKKLYQELITEGYSPEEAKELSEQVNNSEQTNFGVGSNIVAPVKGGLKWLLEHGLIAPFKGRKVLTAYNPKTGMVESFKNGVIAPKDILDKSGKVIFKKGDFVREGGIPSATTLPGKIGMGALGLANVGMTASLLTMPAGLAADFKRNAEYNKKYVIDPEKHYVIEQDLADNRKVRLIGKTEGYVDRTDANIEADLHEGNGMYQVYAIKGSELARVMPRKFTLEYYQNGY